MFYFENIFQPSERNTKFINCVLSDEFPWFYQQSTSEKYMFFSHVFMKRSPSNDIDDNGMINSFMYEECYDVFKSFCDQNNIKFSVIYRAAMNSTAHFPSDAVDIHVDQPFDHKVFLLYLNEFTEGNTFLYNNDKKLIQTIVPSKNKGVIFSGEPHSHGFCAPYERRVVMVVNFN